MSDNQPTLREAVTDLRTYCNLILARIRQIGVQERVPFGELNDLLKQCDQVFRAQDIDRLDPVCEGIERENAKLRVELAGKVGCPYGHSRDGSPCELGYPGCACMDDILAMMEWSPEDDEKAAVRIGRRYNQLRERARAMVNLREALMQRGTAGFVIDTLNQLAASLEGFVPVMDDANPRWDTNNPAAREIFLAALPGCVRAGGGAEEVIRRASQIVIEALDANGKVKPRPPMPPPPSFAAPQKPSLLDRVLGDRAWGVRPF